MRAAVILLLLAGAAQADSVVAARTVRALSVLGPEDLAMQPDDIPGALTDMLQAVGQEARVALYAGRPVRAADIGPPAIVDRNQIVPLAYALGALDIRAEGRALARGGVGDVIRVMNLSSRTTVSGRIAEDGSVRVGPGS
ncbi:flagellar basal body P-ring formation protein FlgA [Cereibacter sphaeroides]|uniref:flagellar basal body P-ring formation chaperone FlgA n=1 Tax=Rhodobacterales TaxID=204455 RepID=UPI000BBE7909|nr:MULTISPECIES: flagellar basal body P-ring formation chaperone FlgA [Paracoccaceae]MCE6960930.1 flagellar basal body P-ring formation protein FlgA [Cereibacter sphaeroides]MCE6969772.1 flagellar basal body P-ring formation protein FlgA [Cereibacter sphaeroides]MCE6975247.1 flagellar basal body P-ring formation protein FlgA [Cereibacter sphaeroides]